MFRRLPSKLRTTIDSQGNSKGCVAKNRVMVEKAMAKCFEGVPTVSGAHYQSGCDTGCKGPSRVTAIVSIDGAGCLE